MSTFKYVIRTDYITQNGYSKLYIRYTHKSKWFDIPTGQSCKENEWNKERGEPRKNHPYRRALLTELDNLKMEIINQKELLIKNGRDVTVENLKELIKQKKTKNDGQISFLKGWDTHLKNRKNELKPSTLTVYKTTLKHLQNYCSHNKKTLSWNLFDLDFENSWNNYFFENEISNGTSGKYFKTLKTFLRWAYERKYLENNNFSKYKVEQSEPEIYPLKEVEVKMIHDFIVSSNQDCSEKLRKIGRMFLFMCYTSLRYSDLQRLSFSMIHKGENGYSDGYIRMDTQKTGKYITVPLTFRSLTILMETHVGFNWYMGGTLLFNSDYIFDSSTKDSTVNQNPELKVFQRISNQKFNVYVKELCSKVGLNRKVEIVRIIGNKRNSEYKDLWETIGAHTARRTFITLSLQKGMRPETIQEITGHIKSSTMYRYNKITPDVTIFETRRSWDSIEEKVPEDKKIKELKQEIDDLKKQLSKKENDLSRDKEKITTDKKNQMNSPQSRPFIPPKD